MFNQSILRRTKQRSSNRVKCEECKALVMGHSNGHGDFVLLELSAGPPWEVHRCYVTRSIAADPVPVVDTPAARTKRLRALYASAEIPPANIQELDLLGTVISIENASIPLRLSNLRTDIRKNACHLLGRLQSELVLTTGDQYKYRICADPEEIAFAPGDCVRVLVDRIRICGMGMFLSKRVSRS
jgi:hypothetical protein